MRFETPPEVVLVHLEPETDLLNCILAATTRCLPSEPSDPIRPPLDRPVSVRDLPAALSSLESPILRGKSAFRAPSLGVGQVQPLDAVGEE